MKKIISIIVPAYNVQKYIDNLLNSFIDSNVLDDIEILIVNDGSTDQTYKNALMYSVKYPNSIKIINKENGGHGSTINVGIKECSGKFLKVVDGDDWVNPVAFANLVEFLKTKDSDMVVSPFDYYYEKTKTRETYKLCLPNTKEDIKFSKVCGDIERIPMHCIVYKSSILKENNIIIDENLFYVDVEYVLYTLNYINSISIFNESVYIYRLGTSEQSMNKTKLWERRNQHFKVLCNLINYYKKYDFEKNKEKYLIRAIADMSISQYLIFLEGPINSSTKKELVNYDKELKKMSKEIYYYIRLKKIRALRYTNFLIYKMVAKKVQKESTKY